MLLASRRSDDQRRRKTAGNISDGLRCWRRPGPVEARRRCRLRRRRRRLHWAASCSAGCHCGSLQARLCLVDGRDVILRAVPGQSRPDPAAPSRSSRGPARPRVRASRGPARGRSPGVVEAAKCARQREECPHREQVVTLVTSLVFKMQFVNT